MTIFKREPREVYRVYAEDEFLAGAGSEEYPEVESGHRERRRPRFPPAALLAAVIGALIGLTVVAGLRALGTIGTRSPAHRPDLASAPARRHVPNAGTASARGQRPGARHGRWHLTIAPTRDRLATTRARSRPRRDARVPVHVAVAAAWLVVGGRSADGPSSRPVEFGFEQ
jgi:hypothetical protein